MTKKDILVRVASAHGVFWQKVIVENEAFGDVYWIMDSETKFNCSCLMYGIRITNGQKIELVVYGGNKYFPNPFTILEMPFDRLPLNRDTIIRTMTEAIYCCEKAIKEEES